MRTCLTKLDKQLKEQMNRIIEHRTDGLTFHYKAIDQGCVLTASNWNQAMGGILQDSINEMGAKAVLKGGGNPLQGVLGSSGRSADLDSERVEESGSRFPAVRVKTCKRGVAGRRGRRCGDAEVAPLRAGPHLALPPWERVPFLSLWERVSEGHQALQSAEE